MVHRTSPCIVLWTSNFVIPQPSSGQCCCRCCNGSFVWSSRFLFPLELPQESTALILHLLWGKSELRSSGHAITQLHRSLVLSFELAPSRECAFAGPSCCLVQADSVPGRSDGDSRALPPACQPLSQIDTLISQKIIASNGRNSATTVGMLFPTYLFRCPRLRVA